DAARVVHQDIDVAEFLQESGNGAIHVLLFRDVTNDRLDPRPFGDRVGERLLARTDNRDLCALARKAQRDRLANSPAAAPDECRPAVQSASHPLMPPEPQPATIYL